MIGDWLPWWIGAYLVGSIPVGLLLARMRGVDIRKHGSGNIGATNVWRVLGPRLGALCFAMDVLKGLVPVLGAGIVNGTIGDGAPASGVVLSWLGVSAAAMCGHIFPVWLRFKGGKGVATGLGAMAGVWPVMTAATGGALVVWLVSVRLTRYVGVSSSLAAVSMPLWVMGAVVLVAKRSDAGVAEIAWPYLLVAVLLGAVVIIKHRGNIKRTLEGTEKKIGERVRVDAPAKG